MMAGLLSFILHNTIPCAWYIFLFTLGMVGASINFSGDRFLLKLAYQAWGQCSIAAFLSALFVTLAFLIQHQTVQISDQNIQCLVDVLTGFGTACLLIYCTQVSIERNKGFFPILAFFENSFLVKVGVFSYSLYLIHSLVQAVIQLCLSSLHVSPTIQILALMVIDLPLAMLVSYAFHLIFERPFVSIPQPAKAVA
jgi:peptidoglycan/LPS O-acetylase OafA/YrhL